MTEETPFNPNSKKGEVRAKISTMLLDEIKERQSSKVYVICNNNNINGLPPLISMAREQFLVLRTPR